MKSETIKLGVVGVDSGQLMICDPSYITEQFIDNENINTHSVYRHKGDGSLWQFCFGRDSMFKNVKPFPGRYTDIIKEYDKTPQELINAGIFEETNMALDAIPDGEFSYNGICKVTNLSFGGQLNYKRGHSGVAVAFRSGTGDGEYDVFAEVENSKKYGKRIKKVWIDFYI